MTDATTVHPDFVRAAITARQAAPEYMDFPDEIRLILAAVLPLHEHALREQIAAALKRISNDRETAAHECADERYHPLMGESGAYWNAARLIGDGKEEDGDDD